MEGAASTEGGEAPRWRGATTENTGLYVRKEQRRHRGCIASRMPSPLSPRTAKHDVYVDDQLIESNFPVVIEVPIGSKNSVSSAAVNSNADDPALGRALEPVTNGQPQAVG